MAFPIMPIVNLPPNHPFFSVSSREQKMDEFFDKGLPPKMAALGGNSTEKFWLEFRLEKRIEIPCLNYQFLNFFLG